MRIWLEVDQASIILIIVLLLIEECLIVEFQVD